MWRSGVRSCNNTSPPDNERLALQVWTTLQGSFEVDKSVDRSQSLYRIQSLKAVQRQRWGDWQHAVIELRLWQPANNDPFCLLPATWWASSRAQSATDQVNDCARKWQYIVWRTREKTQHKPITHWSPEAWLQVYAVLQHISGDTTRLMGRGLPLQTDRVDGSVGNPQLSRSTG